MKSQVFKLILAIIFMTMNGHTHKLFKNILNDDVEKNEGEDEINMT